MGFICYLTILLFKVDIPLLCGEIRQTVGGSRTRFKLDMRQKKVARRFLTWKVPLTPPSCLNFSLRGTNVNQNFNLLSFWSTKQCSACGPVTPSSRHFCANIDCNELLHFLNSMMIAVMLSAPRPSVVCRLGGQLTSIIISTAVASP